MNWEIVASTGEWAGALLVGFTLIYLASQIRQQNRISQYSAWVSIIDGQNQQLINSTPSTIAAYLKGRNSPGECSEEELMQFENGLRIYFNNTQKAYRAHQHGFLRQDDWLVLGQVFAAEIRSPGGRIWREGNESTAPDFFDAVDALTGEIEAALDLTGRA